MRGARPCEHPPKSRSICQRTSSVAAAARFHEGCTARRAAIADYEDTVEIELTAEQMDALLSGK